MCRVCRCPVRSPFLRLFDFFASIPVRSFGPGSGPARVRRVPARFESDILIRCRIGRAIDDPIADQIGTDMDKGYHWLQCAGE